MRALISLALCGAAVVLLILSLDWPYATFSDAMGSSPAKTTSGWDHFLPYGLIYFMSYSLATGCIIAWEFGGPPWLRPCIVLQRTIFGFLLLLHLAGQGLAALAIAFSWAGYDFERGYYTQRASIVAMLVATLLSGWRRRPDVLATKPAASETGAGR